MSPRRRVRCPTCGRDIAVTTGGRYPIHRTRRWGPYCTQGRTLVPVEREAR